MATKKVKVEQTTSAAALLRASIDGVRLVFDDNGKAERNLQADGREYVLSWAVLGSQGASFSIAVKEPAGTGCAESGTLDERGKDAGFCWFVLNP